MIGKFWCCPRPCGKLCDRYRVPPGSPHLLRDTWTPQSLHRRARSSAKILGLTLLVSRSSGSGPPRGGLSLHLRSASGFFSELTGLSRSHSLAPRGPSVGLGQRSAIAGFPTDERLIRNMDGKFIRRLRANPRGNHARADHARGHDERARRRRREQRRHERRRVVVPPRRVRLGRSRYAGATANPRRRGRPPPRRRGRAAREPAARRRRATRVARAEHRKRRARQEPHS